MRHTIGICLLACACALGGAFTARAEGPSPPAPTVESQAETQPALSRHQVQKIIDGYRHVTWHWQRVMGRPVTLTLRQPPEEQIDRIKTWKRVASHVARVAQHPPHAAAWLCIHNYEGSWTDDGSPYYGGLQMDLGFQRTYGAYLVVRKGTANRWTPLEQMWVAERALRSGRGFYPWPNSARCCGLI
jgi:hypothetical protein